MIDRNQAERLAIAINVLRPDWPTRSLLTIINQRDRPYSDLAVALVVVALDPRSRTPKRLAENGPWWTAAHAAAGTTEPTPIPLPAAEVLAEVRTIRAQLDPEQRAERAAEIRRKLRQRVSQ